MFSILLYKRREKIFQLKEKWFEADSDEIEKRKVSKVDFFKLQFENICGSEMERKLNNDQLVEEARTALIELISIKKKVSISHCPNFCFLQLGFRQTAKSVLGLLIQ